MLDVKTVRLVIILGVFLVFTGDYSAFLATIWGSNGEEVNRTDGALDKTFPEDPSSKDKFMSFERFFGGSGKDLDEDDAIKRRAKMMATIKTACLPKLICELTSIANQDQLSEMERSLLNLIRDTSLSTMAEVSSRYHFAAHMGQLISGIEGQGCHNFYPTCPLPGASVLNYMKKIRMR